MSFCSCFCYPKNKFLLLQRSSKEIRELYLFLKLGSFTPHQVYYDSMCILNGLNSMCDLDIHISIGTNPTRIILSYVNNQDINSNNITKGQTFHIYKIIYKEIKGINEINQYDIYNAIQDYIYTNKQFPINDNYTIAI